MCTVLPGRHHHHLHITRVGRRLLRAFLLTAMQLDFTKLDGLDSAVVQDATSGRVLMVG